MEVGDSTISVISFEHLAKLLAWHRACNAYCRDGEHAETIWVATQEYDLDDAELGDILRRDLAQLYGATYLSHEPAPEASLPTEGIYTTAWTGGGRAMAGVVLDAPPDLPQTGYLVRFATAAPLAYFHAAFAAQAESGQ